MFLVLLALGYFATYLIQPLIVGMITQAGLVRPNYQKKPVPLGMGMAFLFSTLVILGAGIPLGFFAGERALLTAFLIVSLGFLGLLDDFLGSREAGGFKGHFSKLLQEKQLTTGTLKALLGGLCSFLTGYLISPGDGRQFLLNGLLIALTANAFNLLDLRPGRASKFFLFCGLIFLFFFWQEEKSLLLAPLLGGVLAYFPLDLQAKGMMGDTGANILGGTLGLLLAWTLFWPVKLLIVILLLFFHLYTEKYSLSAAIARTTWLRYLDEWGRKEGND